MLYRPRDRTEAAVFRGTRLKHFWPEPATGGYREGWYSATVIEVPDEEVVGDPDGIYFTLHFEDESDDENQEIDWEELIDVKRVELLSLPAAAVEQQRRAEAAAEAKGKRRVGESLTPNPHAHLFSERVQEERPELATQCPIMSQGLVNGRARMGGVASQAQPPRKRRRAVAEANDASQGRASNHVRRRLVEAEPGTARPSGSQAASADPTQRGGSSERDADGNDMEEVMHQQRQRRPRSPSPQGMRNLGAFEPIAARDGEGSAGHVKQLLLKNFMCHQHLIVDFNSRINFICGENGSGKTAVLHGLQTCLGVSARQSGRASTAAELILDGADYLSASATLWNTGSDAYLPRRLGPQYTIVREIFRKGGSKWAVLDARGNKVYSKKQEVDEILSNLNINAANPAVCLTQDTARSFGGAKAEQELYKVYMEATHFDTIIENLKRAEAEVAGMKADKKKLNKEIEDLEGELRQVQHRIEELQEVGIWQEQINHLDNVIGWEAVVRRWSSLAKIQERLGTAAAEHQRGLAERLERAQDIVQAKEASHEALAAAMQNYPARLQSMQEQQRERQGYVAAASKRCTELRRQIVSLKRQRADEVAQRTNMQEAISEMQAQIAAVSEDARQAKMHELRRKMEESEAAAAAAGDARQEVREAEAVRDEAARATEQAVQGERDAMTRVNEVQQSFARLRRAQDSPVSAFGDNVAAVLRPIQVAVRENHFHRPPMGPIGSMLSLTDDKWARAVEVGIGKIFNAFIVHDHHDEKVLQDLFRQHRFRAGGVYIYNYDTPPLDLSRQRQVPQGMPTILRVLRVSDAAHSPHTLLNVIIDHTAAERLLLVDDEREGMEMIRGELARARVITSCWARDGWQGVKRGNNETSMPANRNINARLRKDVASAINEMMEELRKVQSEADVAKSRLTEARQQEQAAKAAVNRAKQARAQADSQRTRLDSQVEELRSQREADLLQDTGSLDGLELELAEIATKISGLDRQVVEKNAELFTAEGHETEVKAALEEKKAEMTALARENEAALGNVEAALEALQAAQEEVEMIQATILAVQQKIKELEDQARQIQEALPGVTAQAQQVCSEEEMEASRAVVDELWRERHSGAGTRARAMQAEEELSASDMDALKEDLQAKVQAKERHAGGNLNGLLITKEELEMRLSKQNIKMDRLTEVFNALLKSYMNRKESTRIMRKNTQANVSSDFNKNLSRRSFTGSVKIYKAENRLQLEVKTDPNTGSVKDMKALSGGERSFTSMCFIMALGNVISSPLHCLDEFDVFMDSVNRQLSMRMLIEFGLQNSHLQFILLTPQGTAAVKQAEQEVKARNSALWPQREFITVRQMEAPRGGRNPRRRA